MSGFLAADDNSGRLIFQIIFVVVMIIAWVVRAIAGARGKSKGGPRPPRATRRPREPLQGLGGGPSPAEQLPVDVVYGNRRLEHPPRPPTAARARAPGRPGPPMTASGAPKAVVMEHLSRDLSEESEVATRIRRAERRRDAARVNLGMGGAAGSLRERTRMAILWSEVLGPPRAYRGPHRAPTFDRPRL